MPATDVMLSRLSGELEERQTFVDTLIAGAEGDARDLSEQEMQLITRAQGRIGELTGQIGPLQESARIRRDSADRTAQIAALLNPNARPPAQVEYRSAGEYVADRWAGGAGDRHASERLDIYTRALAHQTTADNPGIIPEPVLAEVLNFVDQSRPIVSALGVRPIPGGPRFFLPRVTQHTQVGPQTAEKTQLPSRQMKIEQLDVDVSTQGGVVNISKQDIDWSQPQVLDIVVQDLAGEYAVQTENIACTELVDSATATTGPTLGDGATAAEVSAALWGGAAQAFQAVRGAGGLLLAVSLDMLGVVGPLFAPVNPQNAQSTGFNAGAFGVGAMGAISGINVVASGEFPDGTALAVNSAAVRLFEQRRGTLSVEEPSVWGVQVAYVGYFARKILEAGGIVNLSAP